MKFVFSISFFIAFYNFSFAQQCTLSLSGYVFDQASKAPLEYTNIYLETSGLGAISDASGYFEIKNLCPADYHLRVSHISCKTERRSIILNKDSLIKIYLSPHDELLDEVVVHADKNEHSVQTSSTIDREIIANESNKNLSDILENIAGVSSIRNGSGVSKPVIHGLYGNRVAILNNGIEQAGQQWGNDHAPEIDPFVANRLSVVKGASALAYGNSLGSAVLVETAKISDASVLSGQANYIFQTNGLGHTLNTMLEKNGNLAAWRFTGTLKLQGDTKSPSYFLTNTGKREGNFAFQIEKSFSEKWRNELYYSWFNTTIGILRGAHIGNLTDLEKAIGKDEPFFTKANFAYDIEAPRQAVAHHLLKLTSKYQVNEKNFLSFKYGGQLNARREFDVRRSGRSDIPALSLNQQSHFLETAFSRSPDQGLFLKTGLQFTFVDNTNKPETGVLPLVPDYRSYNPAVFFIAKKHFSKLFYEFGARYSLRNLHVATFSTTLPRTVERFEHTFHNYAFSSGLKMTFNPNFKSNLNAGYMLRSPEINELYSYGLHQGVSGIEEGNRDLVSERSFKIILTNDWTFNEKLFFQAVTYFQKINDFIYLEPQDEFRLTIRGAFPLFLYKQTDANIYGGDFSISLEPKDDLKLTAKYSIVRGHDLRNNNGLINIPADRLFADVKYLLPNLKSLKNNSLSINGSYTFKQNQITAKQDLMELPDAYFLLGFRAESKLIFEKSSLRFSLNIENLLNKKYRDYLNRLRYFADDLGLNVSLGINYTF